MKANLIVMVKMKRLSSKYWFESKVILEAWSVHIKYWKGDFMYILNIHFLYKYIIEEIINNYTLFI